jgi:hypothetical protein
MPRTLRRRSQKYPLIAFAKIGWCETFSGDEVAGTHRYVTQKEEGHERFNFQPAPDGRYYGYLPPQGRGRAMPTVRDGWLVVFVAAGGLDGRIHPVGWYEDATFEEDYRTRPEYDDPDRDFPTDVDDVQYIYLVHAARAFMIPPEHRDEFEVPGKPRLQQTSIIYARAPGKSDAWRREYADLAEEIVRRYRPKSESRTERRAGNAPIEGNPAAMPIEQKPIRAKAQQELPLKDADDVEVVREAGTGRMRQIHNRMTNAFRHLTAEYELKEGTSPDARFDILVLDYDHDGRDLLVEVKSSSERGELRLAVGQLLDYRRHVRRPQMTDMAVLTPSRPRRDARKFLQDVGVKVLWFEDKSLGALAGAWTP